MKFLHACSFSLTKSTFLKAIKNGNFITWPGLTAENVQKHLPISIATLKGHMNQEKQNVQSTKTKSTSITTTDSPTDIDFFPPSDHPNLKTNVCMAAIIDFSTKSKAYLDLTGRFPYISSRGNQYLLVVYDYDSNAILVEPHKTRAAAHIRDAWFKLHKKLSVRV